LVQGDLKTQDSIGSLAVLGSGIADRLSISINDPFNDLSVYIPKASSVGLDLPFVAGSLIPSSIFSFGGEQDGQIVISDLNFVQNLTNKSGKFSGLEIKILKNASSEKIKNSILKISNDPVLVKDRYELDEAFLKVMNIERWVAFLIAMLTLGIISFNMVGSLWMIVLDKKKDISLLKSIGMTSSDIKKVFRNIGFYIGVIGFVIGLIVALILYFLQKKYNLISVPDGFIMQGYPIEMKIWDVILVFFTVVLIAVLASLLPAVRASKISAFVRQE
jgi:lipoprotein-releasing system permease protein